MVSRGYRHYSHYSLQGDQISNQLTIERGCADSDNPNPSRVSSLQRKHVPRSNQQEESLTTLVSGSKATWVPKPGKSTLIDLEYHHTVS